MDNSKTIFVTEGPIDSLFLPNSIAVGGSDFKKLDIKFKETHDKLFSLKDLQGTYKLNPSLEWYDAFTKAGDKEVTYIRNMLEKNEKLTEKARIFLSTIHAIKGGEEDNVILSLELGDKIIKAMGRSTDKADEEHRVWYVGTTRARNNLYKLKAKIARKGYSL